MRDAPAPFNRKRLLAAFKEAHGRIQRILLCDQWWVEGPLWDEELDGARTTHIKSYQTAMISLGDADKRAHRLSNEWWVHAAVHEMIHLILAPIDDRMETNLRGRWSDEYWEVGEAACDHMAKAVFLLLPKGERAELVRLFAEAREPK